MYILSVWDVSLYVTGADSCIDLKSVYWMCCASKNPIWYACGRDPGSLLRHHDVPVIENYMRIDVITLNSPETSYFLLLFTGMHHKASQDCYWPEIEGIDVKQAGESEVAEAWV